MSYVCESISGGRTKRLPKLSTQQKHFAAKLPLTSYYACLWATHLVSSMHPIVNPGTRLVYFLSWESYFIFGSVRRLGPLKGWHAN